MHVAPSPFTALPVQFHCPKFRSKITLYLIQLNFCILFQTYYNASNPHWALESVYATPYHKSIAPYLSFLTTILLSPNSIYPMQVYIVSPIFRLPCDVLSYLSKERGILSVLFCAEVFFNPLSQHRHILPIPFLFSPIALYNLISLNLST